MLEIWLSIYVKSMYKSDFFLNESKPAAVLKFSSFRFFVIEFTLPLEAALYSSFQFPLGNSSFRNISVDFQERKTKKSLKFQTISAILFRSIPTGANLYYFHVSVDHRVLSVQIGLCGVCCVNSITQKCQKNIQRSFRKLWYFNLRSFQ